MYLITVLARVALGAVFGVAGIAKLFAGFSAFRKSLTEFGVPRWFIPIVAYSLPCVELAAGLLLLTPGWSRAGSVAALALLVAFSTTITANLALGGSQPATVSGNSIQAQSDAQRSFGMQSLP